MFKLWYIKNMEKLCPKCRQSKSIQDFHKKRSSKDGLYSYCKKCNIESNNNWVRHNKEKHNIRSKKWIKNNPKKAKTTQLRKYGIDATQYNNLLELQDNKCKICKTDSSALTRALAVDHCHKTGKIRGLLCGNCNRGLGRFKDSIDNLKSAIKYLKD